MPTSWRVFLTCSTVEKRLFFTIECFLLSSSTGFFCGLPGHLLLLRSPVRSCFLTMLHLILTRPMLWPSL
uniref:Uncharacterized protein n=1 Tax=Anguilla anguilla TaxID=7936 RepID=A0A0E9XLE9_ANGAN